MRLMLDMRGRALSNMLAMQSHRAVAVLAPELTGAVAMASATVEITHSQRFTPPRMKSFFTSHS